MARDCAIDQALQLFKIPSSLFSVRKTPLPADVETLLRAAADDEFASTLARKWNRSEPDLRSAVEFYIEQILLDASGDAYRNLGSRPDATREQLRANMALLMRWLHPDRNRASDRTVYSARVLAAWEKVKTAEKREEYDRELAAEAPAKASAAAPKIRPATRRKKLARLKTRQLPPEAFRKRRRNPLWVWPRRIVLIAALALIALFLIRPDEMMAITEDYWTQASIKVLKWINGNEVQTPFLIRTD